MIVRELPFDNPEAYHPDAFAAACDELHGAANSTLFDGELQAVWRLADVNHVLSGKDPAISNKNTLDPLTKPSALAKNAQNWLGLARLVRYVTPATANANGARHRAVKAVVNDRHALHSHSLSPELTEQNFGELVERQTETATDQLAERLRQNGGTADLAATFMQPLATRVIGEIIGFDPEDHDQIQTWSDGQTSLLGRVLEHSEQPSAIDALADLAVACHGLIQQRRKCPMDDLASVLARKRPDKHTLSTRTAGSAAMNMIAAGYSTTYGTFLNSMRFLSSPEGREHWEGLDNPDDPTYAKRLVPELIRLETGLVGWKRQTVGEVTLADGSTIPAGRQILALLGVANRDPKFADPHTVRLDRPRHPMPVSFGIGPHLCMGRGLAELEIRQALTALRVRFPDMSVASADPVQAPSYDPDKLFRTLQGLTVAASA